MFYPFIQVNIELKAVSNFPSSFVMARFYKYDKICLISFYPCKDPYEILAL